MSGRAFGLLLFVGCVWGASFLLIRVAVEEVSPLQLVFFRSVAGAAALWAIIAVWRLPLGLTRRNLGFAALLAAISTLVPFFLIAWAETRIDSGIAAVLNSTQPLFTVALAAVFLADERLTAERAAGVLIGLAGVAVLFGSDLRDLTHGNAVAQGAVVLASAAYGVGGVMVRAVLRRWDPVAMSSVQIAFLAIYSGILLALLEPVKLGFSTDVWLSIAALGFLGTGVTYVAYFTLIREAGAVRASLISYIIPVVGVALGAAVLSEPVFWNTLAGGAVILAGVGIGTGRLRALLIALTARPKTEVASSTEG